MKTVAIIPSRYGSTRFSGKPLVRIKGKPMIQHVYERAMASQIAHKVVVATDDNRIFDAVTAFGGSAVMTSENCRSGTDRVAEAAELLGLDMDDMVVNVQGDQPLIHPDCIAEVTAPLTAEPAAQMSTLIFRIVDPVEITNPKDVKVTFDVCGNALYFSRAAIPFVRDPGATCDHYYKHLGIYAYPRRFLEIFRQLPDGVLEQTEKLEQLRAMEYGYPVRVVETLHDSPEVDIPEDIARIEAAL